MGDLKNKIITISKEEKVKNTYGFQIKVQDEDGLTYSFFETKSDGTPTTAWQQYHEQGNPITIGVTVQIGYVEEQKENREGKSYTARTIRNFNRDVGSGHSHYRAKTQDSQVNLPKVTPRIEREDTNWTKIGLLHNLAGRRLSAGATVEQVLEEVPNYMAIANRIEKTVDDSLSNSETPLPVETEYDKMIDGIPF